MAKRLNYVIGFNGDATQLKNTMKSVIDDLKKIGEYSSSKNLTMEMQNAAKSAKELELYLSKATNKNTGKLDLGAFSKSIQQSGKDLEWYIKRLNSIGPEGQQAFLSLASAIAQAELPTKRVNSYLQEMWVTMKNTARWQISSSAFHTMGSALHNSLTYAQELNKSLTDIRIVSESSAEDMKEFANQANRAAKELSTTTNEYAQASLIYFQQGKHYTLVGF